MSLTAALYSSFAGIRDTEAKLAVSSANVTNADKSGYTRKEYESEYYTSNSGTVPVSGQVQSVVLDPYLQEAVIEDTSAAAESTVIADYLSQYSAQLGSTTGENTLSASINELSASFDELSVTPEDGSLKASVVNDAEDTAYQLRQLSDDVQDLRARADQEIEDIVNDINASLEKLDELNKEIALAQSSGRSIADLEDERRVELEKLAENIEIDYFIDSNNRLNIYVGGRALLNSSAQTLSYTAVTSVNSTVVYPGGFDAIEVGGVDITTSIRGGELGGLIELRDEILVEEQAKLDEYATVLMRELNALHNQGASVPSREDIVGDVDGLSAADPFAGTGTARIALTDQNGVVTDFADFNLATYATIGDVVADINATLGPDITASITLDGELQLTSNVAGEGISINDGGTSVGASAEGFSQYFGLNNIFYGTGASDIQVSQYLQDNHEYIATSRLSDDPALAVGDVGVNVGDGSLSKEMNEVFITDTSFAAAGNFPAQTQTLDGYADKILADVATRANAAAEDAETTSFFLNQTKNSLQNLTGVNIDEEMTHIVDLEAKYEAAATVLGTIQQLFDELIAAVR